MALPKHGLVTFSWGNVSQIDRKSDAVAIKPSGISYEQLTPDDIVVVDLAGSVLSGTLKPSSDTPTHLELYRSLSCIGGICHTHSPNATVWAQAHREIPCLGTTHADYFYGAVPVTEPLTDDEIKSDYEHNTAVVIVRRFSRLDPVQMPAVLVAGHGPFTWGAGATAAIENAIVLEQVAATALSTLMLNPQQQALPQKLLDKHYLRKHGKDAYYGQQPSTVRNGGK